MGRRNTAIKGCHRCKKLVPTATRYCRCGYDFKKPKPDSKGSTSSASPPPTPSARRKSERRQRITVKPDFYSPSDYENPFKKVRRRTGSEADDAAKKKRGRPRDLGSGIVKASIKASLQAAAAASTATDSPGTPSTESKRDQCEAGDLYAAVPPEKQLQYSVLLAELNRKISVQTFRPPMDMA